MTISPLLPANQKMTHVCFGIAKYNVNDICMLRHSKIGMSNIIGYFFSLSNMPMHDILKRKIQSKKIKNALKTIASVYSKRCGSYKMYLEGDSPYQAVMIMCELK